MLLSEYDWSLLPLHTVITVTFELPSVEPHRLMWRGYGRFTNLTTGSEWFVTDSTLPIKRIEVPAFVMGDEVPLVFDVNTGKWHEPQRTFDDFDHQQQQRQRWAR